MLEGDRRKYLVGATLIALGVLVAYIGWRWTNNQRARAHDPILTTVRVFDQAPDITSLASPSWGSAIPKPGTDRVVVDLVLSAENDAPAREAATRLKSAPDRRQWRPGGPPEGQGNQYATEAMRSSLAALVAEWVRLRAIGDADRYADWMRWRGYRLRDDDPAITMMDRSYAAIAGEPLPPDLLPIDLFRTLFEGMLERRDGVIRPIAIGDMELRFGVCTQPRDIEGQLMADVPAASWWTGQAVGGGRRHWLPPVSFNEVIDRDGMAICAAAYLAIRNAKNGWVTHKLYCYYDPPSLEWHIQEIGVIPVTDSIVGTGVEF